MSRVLLVSYGGAHIAIALPMYRRLREAGHTPIALGLTTAVDVYRRHGVECKRILDYVEINSSAISFWGRRLLAKHHTDGIGIQRDESIAYLGSAMAELVEDLGERRAVEQYEELGLNALRPVRLMRSILESERIDALIATDSPRYERAALNAAAQLGIPSVCVIGSFPQIGLPFLRRPDNGAVQCVLNERIRGQLIDAGRTSGSVVVTGNPAFDVLIHPDNSARRTQLREHAGLTESDRLLLWAEQPEPGNPDLPRTVRFELARICAELGWRLMVRLHPSSQAAGGEELPVGALASPRTESSREALLQSDAVVTLTSTIGIEALVLDKPLIVCAVSEFSSFVDFRAEDGALVVASVQELRGALASFTTHDARAGALAQHRRNMPAGGSAAQSIIQCLEQQVKMI